MNKTDRKPCVGLFTHFGVRWDGQVSACCRDFNAKLNLGNLKNQTIAELWNSKKLNQIRLHHIKGEFEKISICEKCEGQTSPTIKDQDIVDYLKDMKLEEEILPYLKRVKNPLYKKYVNKIKKLIPLMITLEITNKCNLKCVMCKVHDKDVLKQQFMDIKTIKKNLKSFEKINVDELRIFFWGEPLLHPNFNEIINECAKINNIPYIAFDTNATQLTKDKADAILETGKSIPIHILISLDAINKETYNKIRIGGDFKEVMKNVRYLIDKRTELKLKYPKIMPQIIVMKENSHEIKQFVKFWKSYFKEKGIKIKYVLNKSWAQEDSINIRPLTEQEDYVGDLQKKAYRLYEKKISEIGITKDRRVQVKRTPTNRGCCAHMFKTPMIGPDGKLSICNIYRNVVGDTKDSSLNELWEHDLLLKYRISEIKGDYHKLPKTCQECKQESYLSDYEVIEYLKALEMEHLIEPYIKRVNKRKIKVLLVNPLVSEKATWKNTVTLGLGSLAAYIRDKYEVVIKEMDLERLANKDIIEIIKTNGFNVIGITGLTYQAKKGYKLAELIKKEIPKSTIIFGGVFHTAQFKETASKEFTDFVIRGEGEQTFLELLNVLKNGKKKEFFNINGLVWKLNGNIKINKERKFLDLNKISPPARDLMPSKGIIYDAVFENKKSIVIMFSRGCPNTCVFCLSPMMWKRTLRYMNVNNAISELKYLKKTYKINNFCIDDDAFTVNRKYVIQFCNELLKQNLNIQWRVNTKVNLVDKELLLKMKEAGCIKVTYGIESGDSKILKIIGKDFTLKEVRKVIALNKKICLPAAMLMIIGHPHETKKTVEKSWKLIQELQPNGGYDFQVMQPHPGTELREIIAKKTGKILTDDWDDYFSDNVTYLPESFSLNEFLIYCREYTRRDILCKGEKRNLSYQINNTITIPPSVWDKGQFDKWDLSYWVGSLDCKKGLTHVVGKDTGYITYNFRNNLKKIKKIKVKCRISSHSKSFEKKVENTSEITCLINNIEIGTKQVYHEWPNCEIKEWEVKNLEMLKKINLNKNNTLTFKIKKNAKYKNGITIYYKALENRFKKKEMPIIIELDKETSFLLNKLKDITNKFGNLMKLPNGRESFISSVLTYFTKNGR